MADHREGGEDRASKLLDHKYIPLTRYTTCSAGYFLLGDSPAKNPVRTRIVYGHVVGWQILCTLSGREIGGAVRTGAIGVPVVYLQFLG